METHGRHPSQQEIMNYFLSGSDESSNATLNDSNSHKKTQSASGSQDFNINRKSPKLPSYKTHKSNLSTSSLSSNQPNSNKVLGKDHFNSPYYIAVPTPKGTNASIDVYSKQNKNHSSILTSTTVAHGHSNPSSSQSVPTLSSLNRKDHEHEEPSLFTTNTVSASNEYPTTIIVDRFIKWKKILKALISYLREVSLAQEQFARINNNIKANMKFGAILPNVMDDGTVVGGETTTTRTVTSVSSSQTAPAPEEFSFPPRPKLGKRQTSTSSVNSNQSDDEYVNNSAHITTINTGDYLPFGSGSIQDLQVILKKHHMALAKKQYETNKELDTKIIPKLEDLKKDLTFKIKEIKSLHDDFKTNIKEHVAITGQLLNKFTNALEYIENQDLSKMNNTLSDLLDNKTKNLKSKNDPYLLKLQLDLQLKRQLLEEHYLQDSYTNLQKNGLELEKIIYLNIQKALSKYTDLIDSQVRMTLQTLCNDLNHGILNKPPAIEWDNFVMNHPTCLLNWKSNDPFPVYRKLTDIKYPHMKSALAKCVRAGYLLKKNKMKKYTRSYFILTSNYLHEFKSSDFFKSSSSNNNEAIVSKNAKNLLTPVMSIDLNYATLVDANEDKITIKIYKDGYAEKNDIDIAASESLDISNGNENMSLKNNHSSTKTVSKTFSKLLKKPVGASNELVTKKSSSMEITTRGGFFSNNETEVLFSFKPDHSNEISDDESKALFKKWILDIKQLCSFNSSKDRAKYIHEKVLNLKMEHAQKSQLAKKGNLASNRLGKPTHIDLPNSQMKKMPAEAVMTPSIDDNGNLVTVNEAKYNVSSGVPVAMPLQQIDKLEGAKDSSANLYTLKNGPSSSSSNDSSPASLQHQPQTAAGGGGYFGIPLNKTTSNTSLSGKGKTVQSPASLARQQVVKGKPMSPQPQKPLLGHSSSSTSILTLKKNPNQAQPGGNSLLGHKRISSLTSLASMANKSGSKPLKLSQMKEENEDDMMSSDTGIHTIDINKSLYN
ncbi:uncharacterized protein HGUI_01600 [Hanseniaspora guilliermondii]|uniref:PH domain-containing protein n=1 Tax=Hanseniaspora guilliermondii TaxID=56406 RepID=A0A1L0AZ64_9ASCO|nr:uncharacterized protein HGUI_01600 [Hanseniaspora guilliermondii]